MAREGLVAVVGRPNVGKSSFFNYMAGQRISIVDDRPGVTRDRIYTQVEWLGHHFSLIDTGGIEPRADDVILSQMRIQAEIAIETADVILFMVDVREGLTANDQEIASILHKSGKPVIIAVNKADTPGIPPPATYDFYQLGFSDVFPISSTHGLGMGDMLDRITEQLPVRSEEEEDGRIHVAIVGKPNVGKSSLLNRLLGQERAIVSDIAGTTRDAIDTPVTNEWGDFVLIDTAGMRRKSRINDDIERYSIIRATTAIDRADVVVHLIDAEEGISEQDTKIAGLAHNGGKAVIVAVNKWDLIEKDTSTMDTFTRNIREKLSYMPYAELIFISALTGQRTGKLFESFRHVYDEASIRISTGVLNEIIGEALTMVQAPSYKGKRLKINYATQVAVRPPVFVLFVNDSNLLHFSYERYLENQIRRHYPFTGSPIRFLLRERKKDDDFAATGKRRTSNQGDESPQ